MCPERLLDFFGISSELSAANLGSDVQTAVPRKTHFAVSLELKASVAQVACWDVRVPKPLPVLDAAQFCAITWRMAEDLAHDLLYHPQQTCAGLLGTPVGGLPLPQSVAPAELQGQQEQVSLDLARFSLTFENYTFIKSKTPKKDWKVYQGRGQYPVFTRRRVAKTGPLMSRYSCKACCFWAIAEQNLSKLASLQRTTPGTNASAHVLTGLLAAFEGHKALWPDTKQANDDKLLRGGGPVAPSDEQFEIATRIVANQEKYALTARARKIHADFVGWFKSSVLDPKAGGKAAHNYAKSGSRKLVPSFARDGEGNLVTEFDSVAAARAEVWRSKWQKLQGARPTAETHFVEWRRILSGPASATDGHTPALVERDPFQKAAKTYPDSKNLGPDHFRSAEFANMPPEVADILVGLLNRMQFWGVWAFQLLVNFMT